jgi:hypothetical protein
MLIPVMAITNTHFACIRSAGNSTKKKNTDAQNWNQHDPEFYGILLTVIKFYEFYGPRDSFVMNDKATYMWLSG